MFFLQRLLLTILLFSVLRAGAEDKFEQLKSGIVVTPFHGKRLTFGVFDAQWKGCYPGNLQEAQWNGNVFSGVWRIDGIRMTYRSEIQKNSPGCFQVKTKAVLEKPLKLSTVYHSLDFPLEARVTIDGKEKPLPKDYERFELYKYLPFRKVEIEGTINLFFSSG